MSKTFSGKSFSEVDHFVNKDGQHLYCKYWKPNSEPRFLIFLSHGFGGHCARFEELALHLTSLGGFVFSHDHVGHGESEGQRTTVKDYNIFIRDVHHHIDDILSQHSNLPLFIFGQSMGGALAVLAAHEKPEIFQGVLVHGGMLQTDPQMASPFRKFLVNVAATIIPNTQVSLLDDNGSTRDKDQLKLLADDPLLSNVVKGKMAYELLRITQAIAEVGEKFSSPLVLLHGGADPVCSIEGSKWLLESAKSKDKALKVYEGSFHDVIHDLPETRQQCITDIGEWVIERLPVSN